MKKEKMRILYCRIGYMKSYNGITDTDTDIKNGGAYNKNNIGHEIYNFAKYDEKTYGYVQSKSQTININRIDDTIENNAEKIDEVLVIWIATKETGGQYIVGWYENATVYRNVQYLSSEIINRRKVSKGSEYNEYYIVTKNAELILDNRRSEKILGMGEYNIWYGDDRTNQQVLEYIQSYKENLKSNIAEIENFDKELEGKEKEIIIKARENQNIFRKQLLKRFEPVECCLCHMRNKELLIASHIKPWAKSTDVEKLNQYNGFLLCPNHDSVFDKGLITFDDNGNIIISKKLKDMDRTLLNLRMEMNVKVDGDNIEFIRYHRENIFKE